MRDDTVTTGQDGYGHKHAGTAGWSVPGYTELKALGSGGAGDVVLARHGASGTLVAIKYLRRKLLADPQWAGLFRTEAQVLAVLDDPNIVRLYEYVESPWGAAIVMELVDGVSVREILAHQGGTTAEAALVVLQGSLLGLATAHRRGVVHRDYKPENVLVDRNGHSKLTDFGIAARTGAEPVAAGSLVYAPPEQFAGTPASPAGDVYAATATFYECLTGHPPFVGDTAERVLYQHLAVPVPLDPVPEPLRPLVAAGMAKEPENRPADAATFVTALNAIAARAYGPDWAKRGRSHLGEAALLLAALWPSAAPAGVQGSAVEQVNLSQGSQGVHGAQGSQGAQGARHLWHLRHVRHVRHLRHLRHLEKGRNRRGVLRLSPVKAAVAAGTAVVVAGAGVALAAGLAGHHGPPPPPALALPAVTGVSPDGGTDLGGTTVTITGNGLGDATLVTFGGVAGRIISRSDTRITVASPPSTGTVGITATTAAITADSGTRITGTGTGRHRDHPDRRVEAHRRRPVHLWRPAAGGHRHLPGQRQHRGRNHRVDHWGRPGRRHRGHLRRRGRPDNFRFEYADHRDQPAWHGNGERHRDHPGRRVTGRRRRPLHLRRTAETTPVDLLPRPGFGAGRRFGGLAGHRRRLPQSGRVLR